MAQPPSEQGDELPTEPGSTTPSTIAGDMLPAYFDSDDDTPNHIGLARADEDVFDRTHVFFSARLIMNIRARDWASYMQATPPNQRSLDGFEVYFGQRLLAREAQAFANQQEIDSQVSGLPGGGHGAQVNQHPVPDAMQDVQPQSNTSQALPPPHAVQAPPPQVLQPHLLHPRLLPPQVLPPHALPPYGLPPQAQPPQVFPPQAFPPYAFPPRAFPPRAFPPRAFPPRAFPPQAQPAAQNAQLAAYQAAMAQHTAAQLGIEVVRNLAAAAQAAYMMSQAANNRRPDGVP